MAMCAGRAALVPTTEPAGKAPAAAGNVVSQLQALQAKTLDSLTRDDFNLGAQNLFGEDSEFYLFDSAAAG